MNSWNEIEREFDLIRTMDDGDAWVDKGRVKSFLKETAHKEYLRGRREGYKEVFDELMRLPCHSHGGQLPDGKIPAAISVSDILDLQAALEKKVTD